MYFRRCDDQDFCVVSNISEPISRSARGNLEIATRAPVCAAYQTGESPVQSHVKLCS